jgi:hypothetical protein
MKSSLAILHLYSHTHTHTHTCILHMEQDAGFVGAQLNDEPLGSNIGWRENCVGNHVSWTQDIEGLLVCTETLNPEP